MRSREKLFLGIDVGGTNVKLGLVDSQGTNSVQGIDGHAPPEDSEEHLRVCHGVCVCPAGTNSVVSASDLTAVGLAVPGVLDTREFVLREVVNLPGWHGQPLLQVLHETSKLPSAVVNDANSAAYAEHALRDLGERSLALVTLGTGIGCGVVIKGSPYSGDHGCAGELGHIAIRFGQRRDSLHVWKPWPSGILRGCRRRDHSTAVCDCDTYPADQIPQRLLADDVTPRDIAEEAAQGCQLCQQIIDETAQYVGQAVGLMGQVIDPAVVLLGGAMTFGGAEYRNRPPVLAAKFANRSSKPRWCKSVITSSSTLPVLGNDAGVLGAAMVAKQACEQ